MLIKNIFSRKTSVNETTPTTTKLTREIGVDGDLLFTGFDNEEKRADRLSIKDYRKMRDNDATVDSFFNIIKYVILSANSSVRADKDDESESQAEFVRRSMFSPPHRGGMSTPFSLVLEQTLEAIYEGFALFERVYKVDENGKLVIDKMARRDSTTLTLIRDDTGGYGGARQRAQFGDRTVDVTLPAYKTFLFTYGKATSYLYGRSAFRPIWRNYDKKQKLEYLDSVAIQNAAIKPKLLRRLLDATGTKPADKVARSKALRSLSTLGDLKSAMLIPAGYDVKELEGGNNSGINESIERQNSEMAREFFANFMLLGTQGKSSNVGSYSLSTNQSDIFMIGLRGLMKLIEEHIDQYWIADIIDLNFPYGQRYYPEFRFDDLTSDMMDFLRTIFTKLVEKDKVSDGTAKEIEDLVKQRLGVDVKVGVENDEEVAEKSAGKFRGEPPEVTNDNEKTTLTVDDMHDHAEKTVKFDAIEAWLDRTEADFEGAAEPLLQDFAKVVADNPDVEVKLPGEYVKLISSTYRAAYNFGKLTASDEHGKKAPKSDSLSRSREQSFVNFIVDKQTADIESLIAAQRLKLPGGVGESAEVHAEPPPSMLGDLIGAAISLWIQQVILGTRGAIANQGVNDGRSDTLDRYALRGGIWVWSSRMEETTCPTCAALHGSTYSTEQENTLEYQPGHIHLNCRCIWILMNPTDLYDLPEPTGRPDDIDTINHMQITRKTELQKQGLVGSTQTKKDALEQTLWNRVDNGSSLAKVESAIRGKNVEYLAAFDASGKKLAELTDSSVDSVRMPQKLIDFLAENDIKVLTHNHPGDSSFSPDDVNVAIALDLGELRVVSVSYTYSLKPGEDGWPTTSALAAASSRYEQEVYDEYVALVAAGKAKWGDATTLAIIEERNSRVFNEFMLKYMREDV